MSTNQVVPIGTNRIDQTIVGVDKTKPKLVGRIIHQNIHIGMLPKIAQPVVSEENSERSYISST